MRIFKHPIIEDFNRGKKVRIEVDGKTIEAYEGETIAAALMASGIKGFRYTKKNHDPRGIYCGIGYCTDCMMTVNGEPNIRTCMTMVEDGMKIKTQDGRGKWGE